MVPAERAEVKGPPGGGIEVAADLNPRNIPRQTTPPTMRPTTTTGPQVRRAAERTAEFAGSPAASEGAASMGEQTSGGRGGLAQRAGIVAAGTLVSRVLGVLRESVIAAFFPAATIDLWIVAFTIPNTLRGLLAEGAASAAFVPLYAELRAREGDVAARAFHARAAGAMLVALAAVTAVGVVAAPAIVTAFASGYLEAPARFSTTVGLTRLVFPYIFFMGMAALSAGALNAHRSFAVPALAPALLNVALIAAPIAFVPAAAALGLPPVGALGLGALLGGALQVVAQWPALRRVGLLQRPRIELSDPHVQRAMRLLGPVAAGLGVYQLNLMLSRTLASWMPQGSQSYLWFGQRLVEVPQGMFAVAVATAALPVLADLRARGDRDGLLAMFREALRTTLFVAVPASVLLVVLAEPLVSALYQRGAFGRFETLETARSLAWQASGVWAVAAVRVIVPVFHAHNDTRTPVLASAVNLVTFAALGVALSRAFEHTGIAIAISAAGILQGAVLLRFLRGKLGPLGMREVIESAARVALASGAMALAAWSVAQRGSWHDGADAADFLVLGAALVAGGLVYLGTAAALKAPELGPVLAKVRARLHRRGPAAGA